MTSNARLTGTLALCLVACGSREIPTAPSDNPGLARGAGSLYHAVDLGALPGGTRSSAAAINASGQVVGQSETGGGAFHAALWDRDGIVDLGTLGGNLSQALGINNAGKVVGWSETAQGVRRAFLWERGVMADLGTPGGTGSGAIDINARGQVLLGGSDGSMGIWERGDLTPLPLPAGSTGCTPVAINPAGSVIAQCGIGQTIRSVLIGRAGVTDLGTLGGSLTAALAIHSSGTVVGLGWLDADAGARPFLWDRGAMIDLSTRGAPIGLIPNAINAGGQIAGHYGAVGQIRAILWEHGTTVELGGVPGEDTYAFDLNAAGQVVGLTVTGNQGHATLWTRR